MSGVVAFGVLAAAAAGLVVMHGFTGDRAELAPRMYHAAQAPEQAAACIGRNADSRNGSGSSFLQPLYGNERIAVVMSDGPVGDKLAIAYVEAASQGSHVKIVPTAFVEDSEALTKQLLAKC